MATIEEEIFILIIFTSGCVFSGLCFVMASSNLFLNNESIFHPFDVFVDSTQDNREKVSFL